MVGYWPATSNYLFVAEEKNEATPPQYKTRPTDDDASTSMGQRTGYPSSTEYESQISSLTTNNYSQNSEPDIFFLFPLQVAQRSEKRSPGPLLPTAGSMLHRFQQERERHTHTCTHTKTLTKRWRLKAGAQ